MVKKITIDKLTISYTLKRRAYQRRVNLIVHQDGSFVVTAPKSYSQIFIDKTLRKNIEWIVKHLKIHSASTSVTIDQKVVRHIKKVARKIVEEKLEYFNMHYKLSYKRISIRQQKTRWGSCSSEGNLNFNCKIVCLAEPLRDYIIVHELCHVKEMNHQMPFWSLVSETIPDHKERRRAIRKIQI